MNEQHEDAFCVATAEETVRIIRTPFEFERTMRVRRYFEFHIHDASRGKRKGLSRFAGSAGCRLEIICKKLKLVRKPNGG